MPVWASASACQFNSVLSQRYLARKRICRRQLVREFRIGALSRQKTEIEESWLRTPGPGQFAPLLACDSQTPP